MKSRKKIAILGGGITGVTLAKELSTNPLFEIDLIERASSLGGFHRNFEVDGLKYDIGAFVFGKKHNIFKTFPGIIDLYQPTDNNFGSITGKDNLDSYPCTLNGYIKNHGISSFLYTCLEIPIAKLRYWKKDNIPAFVKYYVGKSVYHKTGLKKYIERLYQVPDRDINIEFASKRLSFIQSTGSFRKIVAKKLQGKNSFLKKPGSKSVYVRPKAGFEKIYLALQEGLIANGVSVKLNCTAKGIKKIPTDKGKKFEIEFAGEKKVYDEIISTIPISTTSNLIGKPLEKEFESKNLLTLFYRFNGDLRHNHNVLHNFTLEGSWKRITTFSKYYGKHEGDDYFAVEITVDKDVEPNISQQQQLFESHVKSLGLFAGELKLQGSLLTRNAYPVYLNDNVDEIIRAKNKLKDWGLRLAGRQGEFDYVSSSDATGNAVKLAKSIKQEYREKIEQSDDFDDKDQSKEKSRKLLLDS